MEIIIGTEIVDGMRLGHTWYEVGVLEKLITTYKPGVFVEIGVHEGVLSRHLITKFNKDLFYIGIEYNCQLVRPETRAYYNAKQNSMLLCADCFSDHTASTIRLIAGNKKVFYYCDNGNKPQELLFYSRYVKPNDLLFAHDFSDGTRSGEGLPDNLAAEVLPKDIEFLVNDPTFARIDYQLLEHTRIVGFRKLDEIDSVNLA